ncbi:glycosyltransferase [Pendulispora albinea]|uniref:Glycosyltransferase n=1 Tax=Pendulispora albinea TaxID=2741071 RepID=A0ABZ2M8E7_9BACT
MSRVLFIVPPLTGHVNPTVSVARALLARGHQVAWAAHARYVGHLLPEGAEIVALDDARFDDAWQSLRERSKAVRGFESLQFLWQEVLVPLAQAMLPGVTEAIARFRPDVLAVDQQALAGALAARRSGLPWATLSTTSASVVDPLEGLPKVKQWVDDKMADLERGAGLTPVVSPDLSPHRVIVFSTLELIGNERAWPEHYRFVGPSIQDRPDPTPFPWESLAPGPRVFVSLGTVSTEVGARFYQNLVEGLGDIGAQIVLAAPPALVPDPPAPFLVRERVPQLLLLPKMSAVVCHAGHNTVCESLAHGLPLVVAPIRDDQPVVAHQVVQAGAGVRVRYGRMSPKSLRDAVLTVLHDSTYRRAAERVRDSFRAAGGAVAAADALEGLV